MSLQDQFNLAGAGNFPQRVQSAIVSAALAIFNEVANETQTVAFTGTVAGGTFTMTYAGQTTSAQPFNVSAASLQVALQALTTVGAGNVVVTGGPGPTAFVVTFCGALAASPHALLTFNAASLTGITPGMTVTRATAGVSAIYHAARTALAFKVLQNPSGYAALMSVGIASDANVQSDYGVGGANGVAAITDAHINNAVSGQWNAYA